MGAVIDNLQEHHHARVLKDFVDLNGLRVPAGASGVIRRIHIDWAFEEIQIEWNRGGRSERLRLPLRNPNGPGVGTINDYFERGAFVPIERPPTAPNIPLGRNPIPPIPFDSETTPLRPIADLVAAGNYDAARAAILAFHDSLPRNVDTSRAAASAVCRLAQACIDTLDPEAYRWLRDQGIGLWHSWGSEATSGGDGTARLLDINDAKAAFAALERARGMETDRAN